MKKLFILLAAFLSTVDRASLAWEAKLENRLTRYFNNPIALFVLSILTAGLFIGLLYLPHFFKG